MTDKLWDLTDKTLILTDKSFKLTDKPSKWTDMAINIRDLIFVEEPDIAKKPLIMRNNH